MVPYSLRHQNRELLTVPHNHAIRSFHIPSVARFSRIRGGEGGIAERLGPQEKRKTEEAISLGTGIER